MLKYNINVVILTDYNCVFLPDLLTVIREDRTYRTKWSLNSTGRLWSLVPTSQYCPLLCVSGISLLNGQTKVKLALGRPASYVHLMQKGYNFMSLAERMLTSGDHRHCTNHIEICCFSLSKYISYMYLPQHHNVDTDLFFYIT